MDELADEDTTVLVLSDHGFGPMEKAVYLNRWLAQQGYLVSQRGAELDTGGRLQVGMRNLLRRGLRSPDNPWASGAKRWAFDSFPGLEGALYSSMAFAQVDWSGTAAYALGTMGNIYLNRLGREPQGVVAPGPQAEQLVDRIIADLGALRDGQTGEPVFHSIYRGSDLYEGPAAADGPDVVAVKDSRYHVVTAEWQGGDVVVVPLGNEMHFASDQSGQHELPGILLASGSGARCGKRLPDARLVDAAATILYSMGEPIPDTMDSRVIEALFEPGFLRQHSPQFAAGAAEAGTSAGDVFGAADRALLKEHLAGLGYLD